MDGTEATKLMRKHEAAFRLSPARIVSCGGDASGSRGVRADAADSQQLAVSGLDSNLGKHEKLLTSGQSMLFLVTLSFAQAFGRRTDYLLSLPHSRRLARQDRQDLTGVERRLAIFRCQAVPGDWLN